MKHDESCHIIGCNEFVRESERKPIPRPQPPMSDRRTKRLKTRKARERESLRDQEDGTPPT